MNRNLPVAADVVTLEKKSTSKPFIKNVPDAGGASPRTTTSRNASLAEEVQAARELLDQGLLSNAETRLRAVIKTPRGGDPSLLAEARCVLSTTLEMQSRYRESLETVAMYESPQSRTQLAADTQIRLRVRIGLAYKGVGDQPKAIALLNATLREVSENGGSDVHLGNIYAALSSVYRSINEYPISRDYAQKALIHFRRIGEWRALAEVYLGIGFIEVYEGRYQAAMEEFEQGVKIIGGNHAPHLLASAYANIAGMCRLLNRAQEGVSYLEKAITFYEGTEHKRNALYVYNNLGNNLTLTGDWARAGEALQQALKLSGQLEEVSAQQSLNSAVLDSLGELCMLRGDFQGAQQYLEQALVVATQSSNKWYIGQVLRTFSRYHLAINDAESALNEAHQALALAKQIGDADSTYRAAMLAAEAHLRCGRLEECATELGPTVAATDSSIIGEVQRLSGLLAIRRGDAMLAIHHFSRSLAIFEMLGDCYHDALVHYELGRAHAASHQSQRATDHLAHARDAFRKLGAERDFARAEDRLKALDAIATEQRSEPAAAMQLLTLRLTEATTSRELLLRELAAIVYWETNAREVLVVEPDEEGAPTVTVAYGCTTTSRVHLGSELWQAKTVGEEERFARAHEARIITIQPAPAASPALLYVVPRDSSDLGDQASMNSLVRLVELGLEVCALRKTAHVHLDGKLLTASEHESLMPGFVHSSPAMMRLVEDIYKIRSSDVTVLVTGESGTGKELVARLVHTLSTRRDKAFIPFNCTAVPKELSEGHLFGYRRGAFTGAVADSPGVIRSASGGTLFLDEIGDLPLDVQPKLLRFLQEGEVQPLGEQRPVKTDVRIVAATNGDLERMVSDGRFREDLYYRLNVIRLLVPPLRERRSEVPAIVNHYVQHYSARFGRRNVQVAPQTMDLLMVANWPGNVRQLCNEVQRLVARAEDDTMITPDHLSPALKHVTASAPSLSASAIYSEPTTAPAPPPHTTLADALGDLEQRMIAEAMQRLAGNMTRVARELGITRRGLYLKLNRQHSSTDA